FGGGLCEPSLVLGPHPLPFGLPVRAFGGDLLPQPLFETFQFGNVERSEPLQGGTQFRVLRGEPVHLVAEFLRLAADPEQADGGVAPLDRGGRGGRGADRGGRGLRMSGARRGRDGGGGGGLRGAGGEPELPSRRRRPPGGIRT